MKINRRNYRLEKSWRYSFSSCLLGVMILLSLTAISLGDRFKATLIVNMAILNKLWVSEWVKSLSRVQLFVTPMDSSLLGFSIHGILQARILEWGAISFSRGSSQPRLLHCRQMLYRLSHQGSKKFIMITTDKGLVFRSKSNTFEFHRYFKFIMSKSKLCIGSPNPIICSSFSLFHLVKWHLQ